MQKRRLEQKTLDYIKVNEDIGETFATGNYYQDLEVDQNVVANVAIYCTRKEKIVCMPGIAGVSTDWEDTAKVIFSKIRQETNLGVGHNPESTKTDPWMSSSVENRIHRQMRGKF